MDKFDVGVIHGRFQVLHNDHLKYLTAGKKLCRHMVVGITNPDPVLTSSVDVDLKRSNSLSNPLTYFERLVMIRQALLETGLGLEEMTVTPFPVTMPELYRYYLPMDAVFFLSIYDDWGRKKLAQFKAMNLKTHVLWEVTSEKKGLSSTEIRSLMMEGRPWEHLVPKVVARFVLEWDIPARLKKISQMKS